MESNFGRPLRAARVHARMRRDGAARQIGVGDFSNGPLGCAPGAGTAYAYGSGDQSAGNSYDSSSAAGAGSAWKVLTAQADCNE